MTHDESRTADQDPTHDENQPGDNQGDGAGGGTVSEAGSAAVNPDTSLGGADSVPDTPDVNTGIDERVETNEPGQQD